jgi:hypothetical protein
LPADGFIRKIILLFGVNELLHILPVSQVIPDGLDMIEPIPAPVLVTVRVNKPSWFMVNVSPAIVNVPDLGGDVFAEME